MMAEHGELCSDLDNSYCMNGATCYRIPSINTLSCVCSESFRGSRCEQFQLLRTSGGAEQAGLIAAVVIVTVLVLTALAFVIYSAWKVLRTKAQSQQSNQQQYWEIKPRV